MHISKIPVEKSIKFFVVLTFFVPLIVFPSSFIFPFIVPKVLLFRCLTLLMLFGWILLLMKGSMKPRWSWLHMVVIGFGVSALLSGIVGVDWYRSLWDNHERMMGIFTIFHYILYYIILSTVFTSWKDWRFLMRWFLGAGAIVMIIALLQQVNTDLLLNRGNRSASTLGNPIYVGGYGLFLLFLGGLLYIKESVQSWKIYAAVGAVLGLGGLLASGTRGTLLGLLAGAIITAAVYGIFYKQHKTARKIVGGTLITLALLGGLIFAFRDTSFVRSIPAVGRLANVSLTSGTGETRLMAWGIAVEAFKEKPVFGWGPNNYYFAFNKYYKPEFLEHGIGETWFDNAHNVPMNTLATQGFIGFLLYLSLFGVPIYLLFAAFKKERITIHVFALSTGFLVAHFVHNLFVFENPTSYLYFFFFLAFIQSQSSKLQEEQKDIKKQISSGGVVAIGLGLFLVLHSTNIIPSRANMATLGVLRLLQANPVQAMGEIDEAVKIPTPHEDDIRNDIARTTHQLAAQYTQNGHGDSALLLVEKSIELLRENRTLHPLDIRVDLQYAQSLLLQGQLTQHVVYVQEAEQVLHEALELSPKRQQIHYLLASIKEILGKDDEAITHLQQTVDDAPAVTESWLRLMDVLARMEREEELERVYKQAQEQRVGFSEEEREFVERLI